jgi:hypothetical protein
MGSVRVKDLNALTTTDCKRIGTFRVTLDFIEAGNLGSHHQLRRVFGRCIILSVTTDEARRVVTYTALSPDFDLRVNDLEPPEYEWQFTRKKVKCGERHFLEAYRKEPV